MATDILKLLSKLQKAHDYFGKAKDLHDKIDKVRKYADVDPHDADAMLKLAGLKDKEVKKALDTLEKRAKTFEAIAKAGYPSIKGSTLGAWARWAKALDKHGPDSKEADKARGDYLKALIKHDVVLRERTTYCDMVIKRSGIQVKVYDGLWALWQRVNHILEILIKTPEIRGTTHQSEAFKAHFKFRGIGGRAKRIAKAHKTIIGKSATHKNAVMKIKKKNDLWIYEVSKSALSSMIGKALKAMGISD